jgi:two-component system chemotaxis response regulator CheY
MVTILEAYGACQAATNGPQAIELFSEAVAMGEPYGLITLDIEMPCASGLEVLKTLRQRELLRQIPPAKIIMVSAASTRDNVRLAAERTCDAFIVKPATREALTSTLARIGISPRQVQATEACAET